MNFCNPRIPMKTTICLITTSVALALTGNISLHGQSGDRGGSSAGGGGGGSEVAPVTVPPPEAPEAPEPPPGAVAQMRADTLPAGVDAEEQLAAAQSQLEMLNDQFFHTAGNPSRTLILRSADVDPKEQGNLEEDLAVMSHILDKAVAGEPGGQPPGGHSAAGINILFTPGGSSLRNLYLDGYGALFMLTVNFPLLAPPAEPGTTKETQPTNSAWDEARHELYGGPDEDGKMNSWSADHVDGPGQAYSEEKVSQLKAALLDALKNAANIRDLKADDWITICVVGAPASGEMRGRAKAIGYGGGYSSSSSDPFAAPPRIKWKAFGSAPGRRTVMTLRVKKSDVDAFAKGDLDAAKFQKKVTIAAYVSGRGQEAHVDTSSPGF
jgi:hypothetical protein